MKYRLVMLIWLVSSQTILAQVTTDTSYWKNSLDFGVNFNQASFSDNWRGGGVSSIAIGSLLVGKATYKKEKVTWNNLLDFRYGIVKNQGQSARKTLDAILIDTKLGYAISEKLNLFSALSFVTQFDQGFRFEEGPNGEEQRILISRFMAPGFLTSSWGVEYVPDDYFSLRVGPFAPRFTFVTDQTIINNVPENYGVEPGKTLRQEWLAFQMLAKYERDFNDNLSLNSRYMLFANYEEFTARQIDHRLELSLTAQITEYINTSLGTILIYDVDQVDALQLSQALAIGILIKLGHQEEKK